MGVNICK